VEIEAAASVGRAVRARDAADRRVRIATTGVVALAAALTGVLAAVASGSTHAKRVVARVEHVRVRSTKRPVVAPAPPLVGVSSAPAAEPPSSPVQPPAVAAPTQAPVVVSGGS
jgi:hypothetical protein